MRFQKCLACGHVRWPAAIICSTCYSKDAEWKTANGKGTVFTYAVYRQAFHPAFENDIPYVTAIVALEEGPLFLSNIVGCGSEEVHCDMPVEVTWEEVDKAISLPKFKPARESRDS